jgi:hypothetical protein
LLRRGGLRFAAVATEEAIENPMEQSKQSELGQDEEGDDQSEQNFCMRVQLREALVGIIALLRTIGATTEQWGCKQAPKPSKDKKKRLPEVDDGEPGDEGVVPDKKQSGLAVVHDDGK